MNCKLKSKKALAKMKFKDLQYHENEKVKNILNV
jgi:hypothetical protein